jgi:hypothetical protein
MQKIDPSELKKYTDYLKDVLFKETIDEIAYTMLLGLQKYPNDDWQERPNEHHIEHIKNHLVQFTSDMSLKKLEDLTHATCRCMMLTQKIINKSENYHENASNRGIQKK